MTNKEQVNLIQEASEQFGKKLSSEVVPLVISAAMAPITAIVAAADQGAADALKGQEVIIKQITDGDFMTIAEDKIMTPIKSHFLSLGTQFENYKNDLIKSTFCTLSPDAIKKTTNILLKQLDNPEIKLECTSSGSAMKTATDSLLQELEEAPIVKREEWDPVKNKMIETTTYADPEMMPKLQNQVGAGKHHILSQKGETYSMKIINKKTMRFKNIPFPTMLKMIKRSQVLLKDLGLIVKKLNTDREIKQLWKKKKNINILRWKNKSGKNITMNVKQSKDDILISIHKQRKRTQKRKQRKMRKTRKMRKGGKRKKRGSMRQKK